MARWGTLKSIATLVVEENIIEVDIFAYICIMIAPNFCKIFCRGLNFSLSHHHPFIHIPQKNCYMYKRRWEASDFRRSSAWRFSSSSWVCIGNRWTWQQGQQPNLLRQSKIIMEHWNICHACFFIFPSLTPRFGMQFNSCPCRILKSLR